MKSLLILTACVALATAGPTLNPRQDSDDKEIQRICRERDWKESSCPRLADIHSHTYSPTMPRLICTDPAESDTPLYEGLEDMILGRGAHPILAPLFLLSRD
ncbi:hypothetical protein NOR_08633 [Metarhizium rileyi]|uniref:Uncharacterized protein n=1 Tax=Metarhizium rileyi (strain RCEF 4871) TaxID=1649241 RepID=A0A166VZ36_METRR|nr:hypothetical protein NOR_08633 [Metarhizium rileyi RCEF 4871]